MVGIVQVEDLFERQDAGRFRAALFAPEHISAAIRYWKWGDAFCHQADQPIG